MSKEYIVQTFNNIKHIILDNSYFKWVIKGLVATWMFFSSIHLYIFAIIALTILDIITGIPASIKQGGTFKSRILRKGLIEKIALYMITLIAVFVLDKLLMDVFNNSKSYLVMLITFFICCYEVSSVIENVLVINPKLAYLNVFKTLVNKLSNSVAAKAEQKIEDIAGDIVEPKNKADENTPN